MSKCLICKSTINPEDENIEIEISFFHNKENGKPKFHDVLFCKDHIEIGTRTHKFIKELLNFEKNENKELNY